MFKKYILFIFIISYSAILTGQELWKLNEVNGLPLRKGIPANSVIYSAQPETLVQSLSQIKKEHQGSLKLPLPDGTIGEFKVIYSPVYGKQTERDYPDIQTFSVYEISDPTITGRIGISHSGFYGTITDGSATYMIRPADKDMHQYAFYDLDKKLNSTGYFQKMICENPFAEGVHSEPLSPRSEVKYMRHFRVAISATSDFALEMQYSKEKMMAKTIEALNLLNHRYNIDFGIQIDLIDSTDRFFNMNPRTDYFHDRTLGLELLQQNQDFLDSLLNPATYDLAQVFTGACSDVGGVVWGRTCNNENKARGVSCYSDEDYFFTTFKHEMAHQFSGGHTFNSCEGSSQYDPESSYEPGAGSTILSYGSNCGSDNVGDRMDFFHSISILEVTDYAASLQGVCGSIDTVPNHIPEIILEYPSNSLSIPKSTPFELSGIASDQDGDRILYNWEQFDLGHGEALGTNTTGPLFIVSPPNYTGNYRCFPRLTDILDNVNRVVERLPEVSQTLNFNLTARDQHPTAGAAAIKTFSFDVTDDGPFRVLSPDVSADTALVAGQDYLLKWDVNGSNTAPINAKYVNIMYSTSNGLLFKDTLLTNTPNDGSEIIVLPKSSPKVRFKIKPVDNIFFDISRQYVPVKKALTDGFNMAITQDRYTICSQGTGQVRINTFAFGNYDRFLYCAVADNLPTGLAATFTKDSVRAGESLIIEFKAVDIQPGTYPIDIYCFDNSRTVTRTITLIISGESRETPALLTPESGKNIVTDTVKLTWAVTDNSVEKEIQVANNIYFSSSTVVLDTITNREELQLEDILIPGKTYFWRARTLGACGYGVWSTISFFHLGVPDADKTLENENLDTVRVKKNGLSAVTESQLKSIIIDQAGSQVQGTIIYTLIQSPIHGLMYNNAATPIVPGNSFTQSEINDGKVIYTATDSDFIGNDSAMLIAETPEGLYYGPFSLPIRIDNQSAVAVHQTGEKLIVYPNPVSDRVRIDLPDVEIQNIQMDLFNVSGNKLSIPWMRHKGYISLDVSEMSRGFYLIRLNLNNRVLIGNFSRI